MIKKLFELIFLFIFNERIFIIIIQTKYSKINITNPYLKIIRKKEKR